MKNLQPIRFYAEHLTTSTAWRLGLVSTSVRTIGKLLHRHAIDEKSGLSDDDAEGLTLAVEAFGDYLVELCSVLETCSGDLIGAVDQLEGKS